MTDSKSPSPSRITLGTVQLGAAYGSVVRTLPPDRATTLGMFDLAAKSGVTCLDTAPVYGDAEAAIGAWLKQRGPSLPRVCVVTKLAALDQKDGPNYTDIVKRRIQASCNRMEVSQLDGYLVHRARDLGLPGVADALHAAAEKGSIAAFGVSVYDTADLECALEIDGLALVQAPFSLFDRRIAKSGLLATCAERGITVFSRSVFLQGLVFLDPAELPAHFDPLRVRLTALRGLATSSGVSIAAICLQAVMNEPDVTSTVIGAATPEQLAQTFAAAEEVVPPEILDEARGLGEGLDANIVDPRRWP